MKEELITNLKKHLEYVPAGTYIMNKTDICTNKSTTTTSTSNHHMNGKGIIDEYHIFSGITLSYQHFLGNDINFHHDSLHSSLEINHCHHGRIGIHMKDNKKVFLGEGDMALQSMDCCADADITLPLGFYEGIMINIDLIKLENNPPEFLTNEIASGKLLLVKFCEKLEPIAIPSNHRIEHIFCELYQVPDNYKIPYIKLKILELILFLCLLNPDDETILNPFLFEQVEIIKRIHQKMIDNLNKRFTIEELAAEYLLNTTTLKNTFKNIYGLPIATYMKNYRIDVASTMLRESNASIASIASEVGYESQGKFTKAFKEHVGMSPSSYRKQYT